MLHKLAGILVSIHSLIQENEDDEHIGSVVAFDVFSKIARAEWDTLFFFYGVALMGQARGKFTFFGHLIWTPVIALGYVASIVVHMWINESLV